MMLMVDGFVSVTTSPGKLATDLTAKRNSCTGIFLVNLMVDRLVNNSPGGLIIIINNRVNIFQKNKYT